MNGRSKSLRLQEWATNKGIANPLLRIHYQLLLGTLLVVGAPFLLNPSHYFEFSPSRDYSLFAAFIALIDGIFIGQQFRTYPGVLGSAYVIPTNAAIYGLCLLIFMIFRLDYSRPVFILGGVLSTAWLYVVYYAVQRSRQITFCIIPCGNAPSLQSIPQVSWSLIENPNLCPTQLQNYPDGVVADFSSGLSDDWQRFLAQCALAGVPVFDYRLVREGLTGKVKINSISENSLGTLLPNIVYLKFKRAFDSLLAILVLPALLPLLVVTAILIKLDSPGPILFRQSRIGARGKTFVCYKFRTMQAQSTEQFKSDADWLEAAKTKENDDRITKLGGVLRKFRIDELPQILNILKGEMSWIGPRPEAKLLSEWYENKIPFYSYRHVVPPGISGWAQVHQGHVTEVGDVGTKLQFDFYYIKNFSPWIDLIVLFLTIKVIFVGNGAK
jgi:lipopolysaccharide/colanic/teichoic acid biosynthesis glycosyltransferase